MNRLESPMSQSERGDAFCASNPFFFLFFFSLLSFAHERTKGTRFALSAHELQTTDDCRSTCTLAKSFSIFLI